MTTLQYHPGRIEKWGTSKNVAYLPGASALALGASYIHVRLWLDPDCPAVSVAIGVAAATGMAKIVPGMEPIEYHTADAVSSISLFSAEAAAVWTEAGDTNNVLSAWAFAGFSNLNTNSGVLYWEYTAPETFPGNGTVSIYSDEAKENLVAQGTGEVPTSEGDVTITLEEQNDSGLSGSVTVAADAATDDGEGNTLTLATVGTINVEAWN